MKEASHSHKSCHASQPASKPFFQRKADEQATASSDFFFQAVQPKLTIGSQNDPHEKEADQVADQVVKGSDTTSLFDGNNALQTKPFIHRKPFIQKADDEEVQQKSTPEIQKSGLLEDSPDAENGEVMTKSDGAGTGNIPSGFESGLSSSKGGGAPLSAGIRPKMKSGIGADFSNVRIHNNASAVKMSNQIGARAFTHGRDVYFNEGEYNTSSEEGQHLIAHELTHTVQQGATVQRKPKISRTSGSGVQRGLLDGIGDFFSDIRDRVVNFIRNLPGYFLFTVLLGEDPISDEVVERNGMNFIKGFLLLLPNGQQKYNKLREEGALERSAQWIDQQLATIESIRNQASRAFQEAKDSIGPSDIFNVSGALRRVRSNFNPVISRAINFAQSVARQVLQFLKEALLNSLVNFVKDHTRAYPLLRVLLGKDPITQEEVPRTMENVIHAFLMLSESGEAYYNKMVETGALARAVNWMRMQLSTLPSREEVVGAFSRAWQEVTFDNLLQPVATFQRIYGILSDPIGRIVRFVGAVAYQILIFIKDAMLSWLQSHANEVPGYHLLTVILGRDIFTNQLVPRTATNLIRGFMGLIPGGEQQFQQMQESGVIPRLADRINSAVDTLRITWNFIRNLFVSIWRSMTITDLLLPLVAFGRIIARFREPISRLFAFIRVVITAIIEVLLRMMNFPIDLIGQIINNAMQAYQDIKRDPIGFLKNLMRAAKKGFQRFFDNFVQHLIGGVTGWLFSELEEAGITPPSDISFRSILGMAMEVLGITVDNIFARLAERIGQDRVDRIRSVMDRLTGIWSFVRDVMDRGAVAIWERIQQQLSNLWDIVVEGIRNWIVTRIVQRITARLLTMLDPTGIMTVVNGFITFFRAVQSFIEQLTKILQVINTFIQGVGEIARGNIQQAADFLENALSRALPVAIAFLANQVGLRGLGRRIGEMIGRAREAINSGIDWLIDRAISAGRAILNSLMGRGNPEEAQENEAQYGPEKAAQIEAGLNAVRTEEERLAQDGKISREQADQVAAHIRQNHPVFTSFVVVDGGDSWNYRYAASPEQELDTSTEKAEVEFPSMQLPAFNNSRASSFEAEYIKKDRVAGAPNSSNAGQNDGSLEGWEELRVSGLRESESWVRMHLLTHRFMGSYLNSNLTPARTGLNNPTFLELEADADNFVQANENEAIWYRVNISYQDVDIPSSISAVANTGRSSAKYLSSLSAAWGKYDKENNFNKIRHPEASKDTLNVSGINPPTFTGPAPSTKILTGQQFGVYKSNSEYNTNVALGAAIGVSEATIRDWLQNGVPNSRESALRSVDTEAMDTALNN
jgi:hypothetical protein